MAAGHGLARAPKPVLVEQKYPEPEQPVAFSPPVCVLQTEPEGSAVGALSRVAVFTSALAIFAETEEI